MDDSSVILRKGRLTGDQKNRLARLLDMLYMPSELAEEIGFTTRQVYRVYIPAGCPSVKDNNNHFWINGKAFREWVLEVYKKHELTNKEAFCFTCYKPVNMVDPIREEDGRLTYFTCYCPNCGRKLAKIFTRGK